MSSWLCALLAKSCFFAAVASALTQVAFASSLSKCAANAIAQSSPSFFLSPSGACIVARTLPSQESTTEQQCDPPCKTFVGKNILPESYNWSALLFRSRAESRLNPYHLFINGAVNSTLKKAEDLSGSSGWYKSPGFDTAGRSGLRAVTLEMLLANGTAAVRLQFDFTGGKLQDEGSWFSLANLRASHPWALADMKADSYNYFSMKGKGGRRFFINKKYDRCSGDNGYLAVTNAKNCPWESTGAYHPSYLWNPSPQTKSWHYGRKDAVELRITGAFSVERMSRLFQREC